MPSTFFRTLLGNLLSIVPNGSHVIIGLHFASCRKPDRPTKVFAQVAVMLNRRGLAPRMPNILLEDVLVRPYAIARSKGLFVREDLLPRFFPAVPCIVFGQVCAPRSAQKPDSVSRIVSHCVDGLVFGLHPLLHRGDFPEAESTVEVAREQNINLCHRERLLERLSDCETQLLLPFLICMFGLYLNLTMS